MTSAALDGDQEGQKGEGIASHEGEGEDGDEIGDVAEGEEVAVEVRVAVETVSISIPIPVSVPVSVPLSGIQLPAATRDREVRLG